MEKKFSLRTRTVWRGPADNFSSTPEGLDNLNTLDTLKTLDTLDALDTLESWDSLATRSENFFPTPEGECRLERGLGERRY